METFSILLFLLSMLAGCFFLIALIFNAIRKNPKTKLYFRGLIASVLIFIVSIILFGIFRTPETKEKYEQQKLEEAQEKAEQEAQAKAEQEAQAKAEQEAQLKAKQEAQAKAEQEAQAKAEQEAQAKAEQAKKEEQEKIEQLQEDIIYVIGEDMLETFNYVPENNFALIKFKGADNLTNEMTVKGMYMNISNILKRIQDNIDVNVDFNVTYPLTDIYGNTSEDIVIKATFNNETIKEINFDNFDYNNIPVIADEWWNHNALNLE